MAVQDGCALRGESVPGSAARAAARGAGSAGGLTGGYDRLQATLESCPELRWNEGLPTRRILCSGTDPRFMGTRV